jgi:ArsR family transcriptional regulator
MAQALMSQQFGAMFDVYSAGTNPSTLDPKAVTAMSEAHLSTQDLCAKSIDIFWGEKFDFLIMLCDKAHQECATLPGVANTIHWDIESPACRSGANPYKKTLHEIGDRIRIFALVQARADCHEVAA